jgi:hypothetical protein
MLFALGSVMGRIARVTPRSIVRGIQIAPGVLLVMLGSCSA